MPHALYWWGRRDLRGAPSAREDFRKAPGLDFPTRVLDLPLPGGEIDSIAAGDLHCVYISGGRIFGIGSNTFRQIHHLALDVCDAATEIKLPASATGKPVEVACGAAFTLVRLDDGSVMSAGNNEHSQLGQLEEKTTPHSDDGKWRGWSRVALSVPAERIYARGASAFVLHDGALYSWGLQKHGHLGHGTTGELERMVSGGATKYEPVPFPMKVAWFASQRLRIASVALGPSHILVMTSGGEMYGIGDNSYGKLAVSNASSVLTPHRITILPQTDVPETLTSVHAGDEFSMALGEIKGVGKVMYAWGKVGTDCTTVPVNIAYGVPDDARDIACGNELCVILTESGNISTFGKGAAQSYQSSTNMVCTPIGTRIPDKRFPRDVECMQGKHVLSVACGRTFVAVVADDDRFVAPTGATPDYATRHVMVPKGVRYPPFPGGKQSTSERIHPERFEQAILAYWTSLVGAERAKEVFEAEVPTATAAPVVEKMAIAKRGTKCLHAGSKVRVWMEDVYALGTVIGRDLEGYGASDFEIKWVREDWDPEVVELKSDCETLDDENADRWQHLWFLGSEMPEIAA